MKRVPITEAERCTPYYKYFEKEMAPISKEKMESIRNNKLTQSEVLKIHEINKMFDEDYDPGESGYIKLDDGTMVVQNTLKMPGVTTEMFDWWFAWHGLEPMRYKMWDPEDHYYCLTRNPDISKNTSLSMRERYWNTTHDVIEDGSSIELIGGKGKGKKSKVEIKFIKPTVIGFDKEKFEKFKGTIVCSGDDKSPVIMCHFLRPIEGGSELISHFWIGYKVKDGKVSYNKNLLVRLAPMSMVQGLYAHNVKEFTNLAAMLPIWYKEFKDEF